MIKTMISRATQMGGLVYMEIGKHLKQHVKQAGRRI